MGIWGFPTSEGGKLKFLTLESSLCTTSLITNPQSTFRSPNKAPKMVFPTMMVTQVGFSEYKTKIGTLVPSLLSNPYTPRYQTHPLSLPSWIIYTRCTCRCGKPYLHHLLGIRRHFSKLWRSSFPVLALKSRPICWS